MKPIRHSILAAAMVWASLGESQAQDSVKVLSLDDCIKLGLSQSAKFLRSQDSVQITGAALIGAYGEFLPNLSFNGNYGYLSGSNLLTTAAPTLVNSKVSQLNYQLTSTLNIFNGFADYSALKIATLNRDASQFNLDRAKQEIAFDITQTFLQVILDRKIITYAQSNFDASTNREEQLNELTTVGRKAVADLYQQQAETSNDNLFLIQANEKLKNDVVLLLRKLKISQTDKYAIGDMAVDTLPLGHEYKNAQDLITKAVDQRPDLKSSALGISIADFEIRNLQSGYLPKLSLEGGLLSNGGYFNSLYVNGVNDLGTQESYGKAMFGQLYGEAFLNLSWNLFSRLSNKTNVSIAKINRQNAQINNDDLTVEISSEVKQAYNDYLSALQQITAANKGIISAVQAFDVVQGQYNVGKATFVELSTAQAALLQAQVNKAQADVNLALQKKIIDYYIGK
jgi:outer membrane protein